MTGDNFLNDMPSLWAALFKPFTKKVSAITYISTESSHPPSLLKHVYKSIQSRLPVNTSNADIINDVAIKLSKSKHNARLKFEGWGCFSNEKNKKIKNKNKKKIIWFIHPYNVYVKNNAAEMFLKLLNISPTPQLKKVIQSKQLEGEL